MSRHEFFTKVVRPTRSSCWEIQFPVRQKWHVDNCQNTVLKHKCFNKSSTRNVLPSADTALDVVFDALSRPRSISVWIAIFFRTDAIVCQIATIWKIWKPFSRDNFKTTYLWAAPMRAIESASNFESRNTASRGLRFEKRFLVRQNLFPRNTDLTSYSTQLVPIAKKSPANAKNTLLVGIIRYKWGQKMRIDVDTPNWDIRTDVYARFM